jgi:DNA-binding CsgD family transcriptional regulator
VDSLSSTQATTMSSKKIITYTGLLNETYYRSKDIDSKEVLQLLKQAEAIPPRLLPLKGHLFVVDYIQRRHVGLSGQTKSMVGYDPREVMDNGIEFVIDLFQKDDFKIYNESIFSQIAEVLKTTPHDQHAEYVFSFNYRVKKADGKWAQLFQEGCYVTDPKTHLPIYSIGTAMDVTPIKKDSSIVLSIDKKTNQNGMCLFTNIHTGYYYPEPEQSRLSRREREILGRLADGLSSKQIADKLFLSESTVVNHRKNILRKTNTRNVAELIRFAFNKGII